MKAVPYAMLEKEGVLDPFSFITQKILLLEAVEAYKHFDKRETAGSK